MPAIIPSLAALAAGLALTGATGDIFPLPDTLAPDETIAPDTVVTVGPGTVVLRAKLVASRRMTLDAPLKVSIDGVGREFPAGTVLTTMVKAGTPPALNAGDGPYACTDPITRRPNALYIVIGDIGAKLEQWARFCFIDTRGKGAFDAAFLYGTKDPAPQTAQPVAPTAYHEDKFVQINPKDEVRVTYDRYHAGSRRMDLTLRFITNGEEQYPTQIASFIDGKAMAFVTDLRSDPDRHPYPMHWLFLGASLGVEGVDDHGVARFRINRNFARQYVTPVGSFDAPVSAYYLYRGK